MYYRADFLGLIWLRIEIKNMEWIITLIITKQNCDHKSLTNLVLKETNIVSSKSVLILSFYAQMFISQFSL